MLHALFDAFASARHGGDRGFGGPHTVIPQLNRRLVRILVGVFDSASAAVDVFVRVFVHRPAIAVKRFYSFATQRVNRRGGPKRAPRNLGLPFVPRTSACQGFHRPGVRAEGFKHGEQLNRVSVEKNLRHAVLVWRRVPLRQRARVQAQSLGDRGVRG